MNNPKALCHVLIILVVLTFWPFSGQAQDAVILPPEQPISGPGGSDLPYDAVEARRFGTAPDGYWVFRPSGLPVETAPLPIVVFLHGYTQLDPDAYREWIDHIVKGVAFVIFPDYQDEEHLGADFQTIAPDGAAAIRAAIDQLVATHQPVDFDSVTYVGHSMGGILSVVLADQSLFPMLPPARAVFSVLPGGCRDCGPTPEGAGIVVPDPLALPPTAAVIFMTGDADMVVGESGAERLWDLTDSVEHRTWITVPSDVHGSEPLISDHLLPETLGPSAKTNAHDHHGTWAVLDMLLACTATGDSCDTLFQDEPHTIPLGIWSDGTPVNPLELWPNGPLVS